MLMRNSDIFTGCHSGDRLCERLYASVCYRLFPFFLRPPTNTPSLTNATLLSPCATESNCARISIVQTPTASFLFSFSAPPTTKTTRSISESRQLHRDMLSSLKTFEDVTLRKATGTYSRMNLTMVMTPSNGRLHCRI